MGTTSLELFRLARENEEVRKEITEIVCERFLSAKELTEWMDDIIDVINSLCSSQIDLYSDNVYNLLMLYQCFRDLQKLEEKLSH